MINIATLLVSVFLMYLLKKWDRSSQIRYLMLKTGFLPYNKEHQVWFYIVLPRTVVKSSYIFSKESVYIFSKSMNEPIQGIW